MMIMNPELRKLALIAHVTFSVGWFGSIAGFLALSIVGLTSQDAQVARSAYVAMDLITKFVVVPLCFASLTTGLVQALGTHWGLFQHYWVLIKFLITAISTIILLIHIKPIAYLAGVAAETTLSGADHRRLQIQLIVDAAMALFALLVAIALSIYKPQGLTKFGERKLKELKTSK